MAAVQPVLYYFFEAEKLVVGAVQDNGFKFLHEGLGGIVGGLQEEEDDGVAVDAHVCLFFLAAFGEAIGVESGGKRKNCFFSSPRLARPLERCPKILPL